MRRFLQLAFVGVLVAMTWVTVTASLDRDVLQAAGEIWADPWGKATLFDAYFAFLTVYLWIFFRERSLGSRLGWLAGVLLLGNFAIAAYFLLALGRLGPDGDWRDLFRRPEASAGGSP
ncbi:MAG: DUF1475 domain-containing protein [Holophagales bacterium]|nr:DUF1475 domain-containing protein [Holophagales bacterium]